MDLPFSCVSTCMLTGDAKQVFQNICMDPPVSDSFICFLGIWLNCLYLSTMENVSSSSSVCYHVSLEVQHLFMYSILYLHSNSSPCPTVFASCLSYNWPCGFPHLLFISFPFPKVHLFFFKTRGSFIPELLWFSKPPEISAS